jgi:hypothetical protein
MVTLTLLGLWMFLSLTLVKEGDLGARIRLSTPGAPGTATAASGLLPSGSPARRSAAKAAAAAAAAAAAQGAAVAAAGVNGGNGGQNGRRASWTRKAVTVGVAQVRFCGVLFWSVCVCVVEIWNLGWFHPFTHSFMHMHTNKQEVVDMLFFLSFLPLLWLIRQWAF